MSIALIIGIIVILLIVVIAVMQRSGPRVTTIEHRREDNEKDRDDA